MIVNQSKEMKRKRKEECPSPNLDDAPKRTKVHAQRKFAQMSNINSPVLMTPFEEVVIEKQGTDKLPEPVELLPIKRPSTEDFLTFLCFRGTPVLPPSLNFFNTASIVDNNGQVHEIKSEQSPQQIKPKPSKNGPIDTSGIDKTGAGSSEKPFVAFGVRKRADPVFISKQMDKKRRHALTVQALRRKYQQQQMAKIRAITISKLSEKVTNNKTLLRSNSTLKNETITTTTTNASSSTVTTTTTTTTSKKTSVAAQRGGGNKTRQVKILTTKCVKHVTTKARLLKPNQLPTLRHSPRHGLKKMCLRSFRGGFVSQKEQVKKKQPGNLAKKLKTPLPQPKVTSKDKEPVKVKEQDKDKGESSEKPKGQLLKSKHTTTTLRHSHKKMCLRSFRGGFVPQKEQVKKKHIVVKKKIVPPPPPPSPIQPKVTVLTIAKNKDEVKLKGETFSSDDDEPLSVPSKSTVKSKKPADNVRVTRSNAVPEGDPSKSQRPSRKTKEAAAIYMEILSHKLVMNESKTDDDSESFDSFPELPNVKKTEQRENEMKASVAGESNKRKIATQTSGPKKVLVKNVKDSVDSDSVKKNVASESTGNVKKGEVRKKVASGSDTGSDSGSVKKAVVRRVEPSGTAGSVKKSTAGSVDAKKMTASYVDVKKKLPVRNDSPSDSRKSKASCKAVDVIKKLTGGGSDSSSVKKKPEDKKSAESDGRSLRGNSKKADDSARVCKKRIVIGSGSDSDHVASTSKKPTAKPDIEAKTERSPSKSDSDRKPPPKKKLTPSVSTVAKKKPSSDSSSDSADSVAKAKPKTIKKYSKTRGDVAKAPFNDSDEEPLSKLTAVRPPRKVKSTEVTATTRPEVKPKRECAKRPQNYLPMFSSSDEEEKFFDSFIDVIDKQAKSSATASVKTSVKPPVGDSKPDLLLSCKDLGRRFGKGKVNMSKAQIEQWLKDSAMAGVEEDDDEVAVEEDKAVVVVNELDCKIGKIPTTTYYDNSTSIDTVKLKQLLLPSDGTIKVVDKPSPEGSVNSKKIFRNKKDDKILPTSPKVDAFSPNNERSVYAFGLEESEDVKTPFFRRPTSRRPSSATKSEDEEISLRTTPFRRPTLKTSKDVKESPPSAGGVCETGDGSLASSSKLGPKRKSDGGMVPPSTKPPPKDQKSSLDDFKLLYKVPSSPSASSSSSAKLSQSKRLASASKDPVPPMPPVVKLSEFPTQVAQLVEAATFYPTQKEFQDPFEYIEKIRPKAEQFGICKIVPPPNFKPECKVSDDMRFTAYNQHVHKMLYRWGPNFKELMAIKKYLSTQNIILKHPPWIGGMEVDLPRLYQIVQSLGGLKEVIEKKKWPRVSDCMNIPKSAQDRVTKLDDIYCKYLLPYDTLSTAEREKLFDEVDTEWAKRESKKETGEEQQKAEEAEDDEDEEDEDESECIIKGRNMALNAFYRIARNTMTMWFKSTEPQAQEVEQEFWKHVTVKQNHICVHSGSIDSGNWGYGFAVSKNSPFARHPWNLKVLTNSSGSVLRSLGPVMGVTVPTLHVGMVFSSCCWYRDPHSLPWIEYLHTGGSKIWYGIPSSTSEAFHTALKKLVPTYCQNKTLWLPSDTVMVPPNLLIENGVSLSRVVQEPGQFIAVFPKAFTSSLSTGYVVSESVYFAPPYWLNTAPRVFDELRRNSEPPMFSLERLVTSIVNDQRVTVEVFKLILPTLERICGDEKRERDKLKEVGVVATKKIVLESCDDGKGKKKGGKKKKSDEVEEFECDICRMNLFISMVQDSDDGIYCLRHAIEQIEDKSISAKNCKLKFTYDYDDLDKLILKVKTAISEKISGSGIKTKSRNQLKSTIAASTCKFAGMPTLLGKQ